ncbi:MAG: transporter substrate-binding domain-containing protein, partial [Rhodospirillaceae bacterium]|nr:transporter substrate-binding domain-containing protein [Rhodospirillaceae bacterium]
EIDALVHEIPTIEADINRFSLHGDVVRGDAVLFSNEVFAGVLKDNQDLLEQIKAGFAAIPYAELAALDARWLANPIDRFYHMDEIRVRLTPQEEAWLDENPVQRFAVTEFIAPVDIIDEGGNYTGLNSDLIALLNKKLGTNIVPEFYADWSKLVEDTLAGKVDGAFSFSKTAQRAEHVTYTKAYAFDPIILVVRTDTRDIRTLTDVADKRVTVNKGMSVVGEVRQHIGDGTVIEVADDAEGIAMLANGKADVHVSYMIPYGNAQKKSYTPGLKIVEKRNTESGSLRIAVPKSKPVLYGIVQKGINAISRTELAELRERWLTPKPTPATSQFILTSEERQWLSDHPDISVGVMQSWPPFHIEDTAGGRSGITMDVFDLVNERLGGRLRAVPGEWKQLLEDVKNG